MNKQTFSLSSLVPETRSNPNHSEMEDRKHYVKIKFDFEKIVSWCKRSRFRMLPEQQKKTPAAAEVIPASAPPPPPWIDLPADVTADILHRVGAVEMLDTAEKVCTTWRSVCRDPSMWRVVDMKDSSSCYDTRRLGSTCRRAVDRSEGDLLDINIEYFGTDELLHYISARSSKLKRLRVSCCKNLSGKGLSEAAKSFPELEELQILFMNQMGVEDVEAIGGACLSLRSFTLIKHDAVSGVGNGNDYSLAISKAMPNLLHLRLGFFGSTITTRGYQAILDGCPLIESLMKVQQKFRELKSISL